MFRRKVEHMLMARITQERPPLRTSTQGLGNKGHLAPPSDQTAEFEAPVGIEIIPYPIPDVLVFTFLRLARGHGLCRVFALQNLHAGLFVGANDHTPLCKEL